MNRRLLKSVIALLAIPFFFGCVDDFGDINENPNASKNLSTAALLSNAIAASWSDAIFGTIGTNRPIIGFYCQYFAQTQYTNESLYSAAQQSWSNFYSGSIKDLQTIIESNIQTPEAFIAEGETINQIAVAKILKAYYFSILTDAYGDLPYREALDIKKAIAPTYDRQGLVYDSIFKNLSEAESSINNTTRLPLKGDILFAGDMNKWRKFANSLRYILALRLSKVDENKAKRYFAEAFSKNNAIEKNSDNAVLKYPGGGYKAPYPSLGGDYAIASTIADVIHDANADTLWGNYGTLDASNTLRGFAYGLSRDKAVKWKADNPGTYRILNAKLRGEDGSALAISAAHVYLARAEAAKRGWTSEDAADLYQKGIAASIAYWKGDTAGVGAYLNQSAVALTGDEPKDLEKIALHRWITFYPNACQGFAEWRRTNVPALAPTSDAVNDSKQIPRRVRYPAEEVGINKQNVLEAARLGLSTGKDDDQGRVWWDK